MANYPMTEKLLDFRDPTAMAIRETKLSDAFQMIRDGASFAAAAEACGVPTTALAAYLKDMAKLAREHSREIANLAFITINGRYESLWAKTNEIAHDTLLDAKVRIQAMTLQLGILTKMADLHQIGRAKMSDNVGYANGGDFTEAEALMAARRVGIPIPKDLSELPAVPIPAPPIGLLK